MSPTRQETGRSGEDVAWRYLRARGWRLLARNYRAGPKEVDLIVSRGPVVAFVEVKARTTASGGGPLEQVGSRKRRTVVEVARHWIHHHGSPGQRYRFDAVAVDAATHPPRIVHVPDAWRVS